MKNFKRQVAANHYLIGVKKLNGDAISGLTCPLAIDVDITPKLTMKKMSITLKRCMLDKKCELNTNREPWSNFRTATSRPAQHAP
jgi:hypothetical protein